MEHELVSKLILCLLAVPVVWWLGRGSSPEERPRRKPSRRAGLVLALVALAAGASYYNYGAFHGTSYIHHWEQFHYFLGSKYFPELGYDGIYAASLAAQQESHPQMTFQAWARDLDTNQVISAFHVAAKGRQVKQRFSDERWESFVADNGWFLDHNHWDYLRRVRSDHGYNPTPTWTFTARLFTSWVDADETTLSLLASLDMVLLLVLFVFLWTTYGARVACLCLIVFGLGYPWRFDWIGGGILRVDWLVAVGVAVCLMKRQRYRGAGALMAYAALVRIFPLALLLGPGVLALRALLKKEDWSWAWRFAQGFVVTVLLGLAVGGLTGRGLDAWGQFTNNLEKHEQTWLTNNVGLKNVLLYDVDTLTRTRVRWDMPEPWIFWQQHMNQVEAERAVPFYLLAGLFVLLAGLASWREPRDTSLLPGIAAVYALTLLTCYYWAMLLLVPVRDGRRGAAVLLLLSAGLYAAHLATPPAFEMIYGIMSWALGVLAVVWLAPQAWAAVGEMTGRRPAVAEES